MASSKTQSGVEVPDEGADFYQEKDVPHGGVGSHYYYSRITGTTRQAFVYTPPDYDKKPDAISGGLPSAGHGGRPASWVEQGQADLIMDNLIAQKAREMILVMEDAGTGGGFADGRGRGSRGRGNHFRAFFHF